MGVGDAGKQTLRLQNESGTGQCCRCEKIPRVFESGGSELAHIKHMKPIVLVLLTVLFQGAAADSFEDAFTAYKSRDYETALTLFRPLAEMGDRDAQHNLGVMYFLGQGVSQDYVQAYAWMHLSAGQGHKNASRVRERIATKLTPEQIAEAENLARDWAKKESGSP